jgi:hypothetical protein
MVRIAISGEAFEAIALRLPLGSVGFEPEANERGERLIWLEPNVVDRLRFLRGPGESFSDVILRSVPATRKQAAALVDAAFAQVVFKDNKDPKLYGLALLCRSISNFQMAVTMARRDQAVECLTLVRSCWENLFLVHQLHQTALVS